MTRWPPLRAAGDGLAFGPAAYRPEGLVLNGEVFRWDDVGGRPPYLAPERWPGLRGAGWSLDLVVHQASMSLVPTLAVAVRTGEPPHYDEPPRTVPLRAVIWAWHAHRYVAAQALAAYLRDEPRARAGLADAARAEAVLRALKKTTGRRSGLPAEPLMGDSHDVHQAVLRAYRALVPRRYDDRRVDADPAPSLPDLVAAARLELRGGLRDRVPDGDLLARARPFAGRAPWPFAALL